MSRLSELMDERRINARLLSMKTGVPERTVYRHYKGEANITLQVGAAYAKALKVKMEDLVEPQA